MNNPKIAFFAGSFDPVTLGHLDLFQRAAQLFDGLVIGLGVNAQKNYLFSEQDRLHMLDMATPGIPNCSIMRYQGLTTEAMKEAGATILVRGLRNAQDLAYEQPIEEINRSLLPEIEVVYLMSRPSLAHISSSIVREMLRYHAPLDQVVPAGLIPFMKQRMTG